MGRKHPIDWDKVGAIVLVALGILAIFVITSQCITVVKSQGNVEMHKNEGITIQAQTIVEEPKDSSKRK